MFYLKCLLILCVVVVTVLCNYTRPTPKVEVRVRYVNHTSKMLSIETKSYFRTLASRNVSIPLIPVTTETENTTSKYVIKHFASDEKRRAVLIINGSQILRSRGRKKKRGRGSKSPSTAKVESLLYEEYDADGMKLMEFMMYSMEDVSKFFEGYLHTEICHVRCEPRPEDIAREEAKRAASSTIKP